MTFGHKQQEDNIEWRREKVRELSAKSLSIREIANVLKIPKSTIHDDITYLRQQAKENISQYIEHTLPEEFSKIHMSLELVNKNCWQRYEQASSEKERYMYLSLAKETAQLKASLLDSSIVIDRAIQFVNKARGLTGQNTKVVIDNQESRSQMEPTQTQSGAHMCTSQAQTSRDISPKQAQSGSNMTTAQAQTEPNIRFKQAQSSNHMVTKQGKKKVKHDNTTKP